MDSQLNRNLPGQVTVKAELPARNASVASCITPSGAADNVEKAYQQPCRTRNAESQRR